jgi:uncharacterized membrane protein YfcA
MMLDVQLISIGIGLCVGLILALSGAGGGIFAIPILVFGLGLSITQAAPVALLAVMSAASIGAIQGLNKGIVRYKSALLIAVFGTAFAPLGVWLAKRTPTHMLSLIFAMILIYVAIRMWRTNLEGVQAETLKPDPACAVNPVTSKLFWTASCTKRLVFTGSVAGLLSGLLGVGGGFVIVPSLRKVSNFDTQTIIATSLAIIALVSAGSVITYLLHGGIDWEIAAPFVVSTMVGMFVFRLFSHKIPAKINQRSFAVLAVVAAVLMIIKSI